MSSQSITKSSYTENTFQSWYHLGTFVELLQVNDYSTRTHKDVIQTLGIRFSFFRFNSCISSYRTASAVLLYLLKKIFFNKKDLLLWRWLLLLLVGRWWLLLLNHQRHLLCSFLQTRRRHRTWSSPDECHQSIHVLLPFHLWRHNCSRCRRWNDRRHLDDQRMLKKENRM